MPYLCFELWRAVNTRLALLGSALMPYGCCQCACEVKSEVIVQLQLRTKCPHFVLADCGSLIPRPGLGPGNDNSVDTVE